MSLKLIRRRDFRLTEVNPCDKGVGIIVVLLVFCDVTETEHVQLLVTCTSQDVDREEDWKGDAAADEADDDRNLEISQEEVSIQRL